MITFIVTIVYILIGIFVNYRYNKEKIIVLRQNFPIISKIIIVGLIFLWPAIICAKIENHFVYKDEK